MIAAGLYDEIRLIICPFVIGGSTSVTPVQRDGEIAEYMSVRVKPSREEIAAARTGVPTAALRATPA
mgnify:CR=1 FL=1